MRFDSGHVSPLLEDSSSLVRIPACVIPQMLALLDRPLASMA